MIQETDSKQLKLPDRKETTLCEAVSAFVFGKVNNVLQQMLDGEAETDEQSARAKGLIERLHSAAYAGHIKFRGLKNGGDPADGHKDIDRLYFSESRGLRWNANEIWSRDLSRNHPKFKSRPPFSRWIGIMSMLTGNTLRHCCKKWAFQSRKIPLLIPWAKERLPQLARRGDPLPNTSFCLWLNASWMTAIIQKL
jgi:hypothetical protein